MNLAKHTTGERSCLKVVCDNCGSLSIKVGGDPANSPDTAIVKWVDVTRSGARWRTCMFGTER
jgi:hypothetical protein